MLASSIVVVALLYALILMLQKSDSSTIEVAKKVDALIVRYCEITKKAPSAGALFARFPQLTKAAGWIFFTDSKTCLTMKYPVKWWNRDAIGVAKTSAFAATPYAYVVEYHCRPPKQQEGAEKPVATK